MAKIIVFTNLTLDGVMQAPGRPDEDTRDGFKHGGWATPFAAMQEAGGAHADVGGVLFGRWTYEGFYAFWPNQPDNPFTTFFNNIQKYVASTTLKAPLAWSNSTLLEGDIAKAVGKLKEEQDKDIIVFGSGVLIQSLIGFNLVDEYVLLIHPLVLGSGRRLFTDGGIFAALRLIDSKTTSTGVVIATYEPADSSGRAA
ncbi:MAG: dihydrofolate reductase family protein [Blastocatellia bacterium]|nr:dihydrofolate reductase family protein [Blastocatellia bacterium]